MLSIIVPIYNAQDYLTSCLESILKNMTPEFECILTDDGSTDGSFAIAMSYAQRFPDSFTLLQQNHLGQSAARNNAIRHARGTYLGFVDADDLIAPDMFHKMLAAAKKSDADLIFCDVLEFNENGQSRQVEYASTPQDGIQPKHTKTIVINTGNGVTNKLIRKTVFTDTGIYFPKGIIFEDFAIVPLLISQCRLIVKVPETLYYYRIRKGSTIHTADHNVYDLFAACDHLLAHAEQEFIEEVQFIIFREIFLYALPRYVHRLDHHEFLHFHSLSQAYANHLNGTWSNQPYIKKLGSLKRVYLLLSSKGYQWPIRLTSRLKNLKIAWKKPKVFPRQYH